MATYRMFRTVSYEEFYEVEAGSETEAVAAVLDGIVDPAWSDQKGVSDVAVDSIEPDEDEDAAAGKVTPVRIGWTCRECGEDIHPVEGGGWAHDDAGQLHAAAPHQRETAR